MINIASLLLKWFFLALLYLFLAVSLFIVYRELRSETREPSEDTPAGAETAAKLVVLESPVHKTGETTFLKRETIIGRTPDCDVVVSDTSVSHKHARIAKSAGGFMLEDLGSKNGTFLNKRKVITKVRVKPGDLIKVGKTVFEFTE